MIVFLLAFSDAQLETLASATMISASLSLVGSLFIIISWLVFRTSWPFGNRLVLCVSICDLVSSIAYLYGGAMNVPKPNDTPYSTECILQSFMLQFWILASILWTTVIAFNLWAIIVKQYTNTVQWEIRYHIICWGLTAILSSIPLFTDAYGPAGLWCWIPDSKSGYRFGVFYGWLFICFSINLVFYVLIIHEVRQSLSRAHLSRRTQKKTRQQIQGRLSLYILSFLLSWIWGSLNRTYQLFHNGEAVYWLFLMHSMGAPGNGLLNSLVYGFTNNILTKWRDLFRSWLEPSKHTLRWELRFGENSRKNPISSYETETVSQFSGSDDYLSPQFYPESSGGLTSINSSTSRSTSENQMNVF